MSSATIVAPLALAVVLVLSGLAKLRNPAGVDASFRDMAVPSVLNRPSVRAVFPWSEVLLGVLLVVSGGWLATLASVAVLALFLAYLMLIWEAYRRPVPISCGCFGEAVPSVISASTVVRNVVLVVFAGVAVLDSVHDLAPLLRLYLTDAGEWVLAMAAVGGLSALILRDGVVPTRAEPAASGSATTVLAADNDVDALEDYQRSPIPYASLERADGTRVTLRDLAREKPALLVWASATCGSCVPVLEQMASWPERLAPVEVHPLVSSAGALDGFPEIKGRELVDPGYETMRLFEAAGTPSAVLLGADGLLAGGPVSGTHDVLDFVDQIATELREAAVAEAPQPVDDAANGPLNGLVSPRPSPDQGVEKMAASSSVGSDALASVAPAIDDEAAGAEFGLGKAQQWGRSIRQ